MPNPTLESCEMGALMPIEGLYIAAALWMSDLCRPSNDSFHFRLQFVARPSIRKFRLYQSGGE